MKTNYKLIAISFLISVSHFSNAQFTARYVVPFSKVFTSTPILVGPSIQLEYAFGGGKKGAKSRLYAGAFYDLLNLGKIHGDSLTYKHFLLDIYGGYAYYFNGDNESAFSNYVLGEFDYLIHSLVTDDSQVLQGTPSDKILYISRLSSPGISIGTGVQFRSISHTTHKSGISFSGYAFEFKLTLPFNSTPQNIQTYSGGTYKGEISPYMKLRTIATLSLHIIMP